MISWFERHRANPASPGEAALHEKAGPEAYLLRLAAAHRKRAFALAQGDTGESLGPEPDAALVRRLEFWLDTCREVTQMRQPSNQVLELYKQHGCRFFAPKPSEAQEILDALDSAMPSWDIEHPALFYQTLELNFPVLVRVR